VLEIPAVGGPSEIRWTDDHVVLLCAKSQDTVGAVEALAAWAPPSIALVCVQNAVANERVALRYFPNVYGAVVMSPTAHMEPGVVVASGVKDSGVIDLGRFPSGVDQRGREIAAVLNSSRYSSTARPDIMRFKYSKLLANLTNAVDGVCGRVPGLEELTEIVRQEAHAVLRAAGIDWAQGDEDEPRRRKSRLELGEVDGHPRSGSSTWQSLQRGTGGAETDFLNGEIVLLGREHGVPTPANALFQALVRQMLRDDLRPGWLTPEQIQARL
jgi:2-dehydropantoate 2-reductase